MKNNSLTILIPVYNGASTLPILFEGLAEQYNFELVESIIFIDDCSSDRSSEIINKYKMESKYPVSLIQNVKNNGLASNYNYGLANAKTDFIIFMHQDILLTDRDSFKKILQPFEQNDSVLATYPSFIYPAKEWSSNPFWQKALFSRIVDRRISKFNGKFDCIKRVPDLPIYDNIHYRTAGEDFDYEIKLSKLGKVVPSKLEVDHIQSERRDFSIKDLIKKEAQLAECYGVNFRRHFLAIKLQDIILINIRCIIVLSLFIPIFYIRVMGATVMLILSLLYTRRLLFSTKWELRKLILPFINIATFFIYTYAFLAGLIRGRQII